jgi:hypothetical protein
MTSNYTIENARQDTVNICKQDIELLKDTIKRQNEIIKILKEANIESIYRSCTWAPHYHKCDCFRHVAKRKVEELEGSNNIEQDVNQMLISLKDLDRAGMEEAMAAIIIASVNQHGVNSVLDNLESRGDTPLIRWVIRMLRDLKNGK